MKKTRAPTYSDNKEKAYLMWVQAGGEKSPKGILTKIANSLGVTSGTVRGWKNRFNWTTKCNVATEVNVIEDNVATNKKEELKDNNIIKANDMYLSGVQVDNIARTINVDSSTVYRWISKYKWADTRERLLIKVTDKLYRKHKRERLKERESAYRYAGLIRALAIQKITGKEYSLDENGEKVLLPKLRGKSLAAEINALSTVMKLIEDSNNFQDRMLGIKSMDHLLTSITDEYNTNMKKIIESNKFILSTEMKLIEVESKLEENDSNQEIIKEYEAKLDEWSNEVWKDE